MPRWSFWPTGRYYALVKGTLYRGSGHVERFAWKKLRDDVVCMDAVEQSGRQILYVSTGKEGVLFKSMDNGENWVELPGPPVVVTQLVVHPTKPLLLFAVSMGGLHRSINGGLSWDMVPAPLVVRRVVFQEGPQTSLWLLGTSRGGDVVGGAVYVAEEDGSSVVPRNEGVPVLERPGKGRTVESYRPGMVNVLPVGRNANLTLLATTQRLLRSTGGGRWETVSEIPEGPFDVTRRYGGGALAFSLPDATAPSLLESEDGTAWEAVALPPGLSTIRSVSVSTGNTFILGNDDKMFLRRNGHDEFVALNHGLSPLSEISALLVLPGTGARMLAYAHTAGELAGRPNGGIFFSANGGSTWKNVYANEGYWGDGYGERAGNSPIQLIISPHDPQEIWAWGMVDAVSRDGGQTWRDLDGGCSDLELSALDPKGVFCVQGVNEGSILRSADGGRIWTNMSEIQKVYGWNLVGDPASGSIVLASREKLYRSRDEGWTWDYINFAYEYTDRVIPILAKGDTIVVLVTKGRDRIHAFLHRTDDGGRSWRQVTDFFSGQDGRGFQVLGVQHGPEKPTLWMRGIEVEEYERQIRPTKLRSWVAKSTDLGVTWERTLEFAHGTQYDHRWAVWFASSPDDLDRVYVGLRGRRYASDDGGRSWRRWGTDLLGGTETRLRELRRAGSQPVEPEDAQGAPAREVVAGPSPSIATTDGQPARRLRSADNMVMVLVPAGEFRMGSTETETEQAKALWRKWGQKSDYAVARETPARRVTLSAFYIDRVEVTNEQYQRFVRDTGRKPPANKKHPQSSVWKKGRYPQALAGHPVVNVLWEDAAAYCRWAGARLPTEAEWEKAARGTDGRIFPWGNTWTDSRANRGRVTRSQRWSGDDADGYQGTAPVGSFESGASPYGALDMAGNVSEWVQDWYERDYYRHAPELDPKGPSSGQERVVRGGSWFGNAAFHRTSARTYFDPRFEGTLRYDDVGFRCAQSP